MKLLSNNRVFVVFIISSVLATLSLTIGASAGYCARVATLTYSQGEVGVKRAAEKKWTQANMRMSLYMGDSIKTGKKSSAEILLDDGSVVRMKENSLMEIKEMTEAGEEKKTSIGMKLGKIWTNITPQSPDSRFKIEGSSAVVGVRGTSLAISVDASQTMRVLVFDGSVEIATIRKKLEEVQSVILSANQAVNITAKQLFKPETIKSEEKEEWNQFIQEIEQKKKESSAGTTKEEPKEIKYFIKAVNKDGEPKESQKYSIPVKSTTGGETK